MGNSQKEIVVPQQTVDCALRHIRALFIQNSEHREADFGEPCAECKYALKECEFDWLRQFTPLLDNSDEVIPYWCGVHSDK